MEGKPNADFQALLTPRPYAHDDNTVLPEGHPAVSHVSRALVHRMLSWDPGQRPSAVRATACVLMAKDLDSSTLVRMISLPTTLACQQTGSPQLHNDTSARHTRRCSRVLNKRRRPTSRQRRAPRGCRKSVRYSKQRWRLYVPRTCAYARHATWPCRAHRHAFILIFCRDPKI